MQGRRNLELKHLVMSSLTGIKGWSVLKNSIETLIFLLKTTSETVWLSGQTGKKNEY